MGFLDVLYFAIFGGILIITSTILLFSLKSTDDEVKKKYYQKTYSPFLVGSVVMLIIYLPIVSIGNTVVNLMNK
ncbi:hypothetical protein ACQKNX_22785 [Lysinibacillus sp. NPDC093712]|uniref:hypothetical protein n=1 Tax=Lysinibacillus sp. NPDC093712 TaxID=3390579 RepID=UPI003D059EEE